MRIGIDFDGTITKNPHLFKFLINNLANVCEFYIISGTHENLRDSVISELINFEIKIHSDNIILKENQSHDVDEVTEWKYRIVDKLKIRLFIDNRFETITKINELCTTFLIR